MSTFDPMVSKTFMTKMGANFYAWRARRAGFDATVFYCGNWVENGGNYSVKLIKK